MARHTDLGRAGESAATALLVKNGYRILAANYRGVGGEIDIIAMDGETVVFVEVKTRASKSFGRAASAVTPAKIARIKKTAMQFLVKNGIKGRNVRFDAVTIEKTAGEDKAELVKNAFS